MRRDILTLVPLLLVACGDKADDTAGDTGSAEPATWEEVRDEVLVPSCGFGTCHAPPGSAGFAIEADTPEDAYIEEVAFQDESYFLVDPGNPDDSYLLMKLEGTAGIDGDPMPPPTGGLDPAKIDMVRSWISNLE